MKQKNIIIVMSIAIVLVGLACFLIGGYLSGWNILGWFTSTTAYLFYICAGLYIGIVGYIFFKDKIDKM